MKAEEPRPAEAERGVMDHREARKTQWALDGVEDAARKLQEIDDFLAKVTDAFPPGDGYAWVITCCGALSTVYVGGDDYETDG